MWFSKILLFKIHNINNLIHESPFNIKNELWGIRNIKRTYRSS